MTPLVLKFGGSAFLTPDGYIRVARYVSGRTAAARRPAVVVVSAMSGTTGRLKETLGRITSDPPQDAAALLLTSGEVVSVALMTAALARTGASAVPISAADTGLRGDGPASDARLRAVDPGPLRRALAERGLAVVPGGQAVDESGRILLLGRNSSDLSAVALAGALGADTCELFSDVPGVCTADPFLVPQARLIERISFAGIRRMAVLGAKVVHGSAVTWAERTGVRIRCRPLSTAEAEPGPGTVIGDGPAPGAVVAARLGRSAFRISALWLDGRESHVLTPGDRAPLRARAVHAEIFPDASEDGGLPRSKAYSDFSDLLIGGAVRPRSRRCQ
jgi:aspartate kinase